MEFLKSTKKRKETESLPVESDTLSIGALKAILTEEREAIDTQIQHVEDTVPDHFSPIDEQLAHSRYAAVVEGRSQELSVIASKVLRAIEERYK